MLSQPWGEGWLGSEKKSRGNLVCLVGEAGEEERAGLDESSGNRLALGVVRWLAKKRQTPHKIIREDG